MMVIIAFGANILGSSLGAYIVFSDSYTLKLLANKRTRIESGIDLLLAQITKANPIHTLWSVQCSVHQSRPLTDLIERLADELKNHSSEKITGGKFH